MTIDQEYDAVIIGSGMGGMSTAALLANDGYNVLILEQALHPGGCSSSYPRKGYVFESGATTLIGFDENQPLKWLENKTGIHIPREELSPSMKVRMGEDTITRYKDKNEWIREAGRVFGEEKAQKKFWDLALRISDVVWKVSLRNPFFPPQSISEWLGLASRNNPFDVWVLRYALSSVMDVAEHNIPVLILGPSGSGKEVVAQSLADLSGRSGKLISVNCASIPKSLLEAELFGYEKGAFTGAMKTHKGKFEQAHNGTLFLDEIGDMPLDLQSKLLRALETKCFSPVGSSREIEVDFRLICATHKNLYRQVVLKNFRSDLFFRISAFPIRVPALKDRPGDIENLVYHLAQQLTLSGQSNMKFEFEGDALWLLKTFSWPGNVRQLRNVIECLIIRSGGQAINAIQVQQVLREQNEQGLNDQGSPAQQALNAEESNRSPLDSVTDYRSFFGSWFKSSSLLKKCQKSKFIHISKSHKWNLWTN